jgi:NAD-specific glutamate dehydrogenase
LEAALAHMAVTFRAGPLLTDPSTIRIPFPAERQDGNHVFVVNTNASTLSILGRTGVTGELRLRRLDRSSPYLLSSVVSLLKKSHRQYAASLHPVTQTKRRAAGALRGRRTAHALPHGSHPKPTAL